MNAIVNEPVVIIGAGWAGLAAAVNLTQQGYKVLVFESAKQVGGRARQVKFNNLKVDNGQHLLIGAYTECLNLMKTVGIDSQRYLTRLPLLLTVIDKSNIKLNLSAPALPAPFHLLYALLTAKGLSFKERFSAIWFGLYLRKNNYTFKEDISLSALLQKTRQPEILIRQLWEPLCLATMNTPIKNASANIFMRVFKDAFTNKTKDADLLLPTVDLSTLFPEAAVKFIKNNGGEVHLKSRVEKIEVINNIVTEIQVKNNNEYQSIKTSNIIIATAPQNIKKLLAGHSVLDKITSNIEQYHYEPIVTVYLQYAETTKLRQAMIGLSSTISQWVFDRGSICQQPGLMSVVISSHNEHNGDIADHMAMDDDTITQTVHNEITKLFSEEPTLLNSFVIREKRATFASEVNINDIRPKNTTPVPGLLIAGDYTDTGYPATLEGAVRSGLKASRALQRK